MFKIGTHEFNEDIALGRAINLSTIYGQMISSMTNGFAEEFDTNHE